ncbi:dihydrolipoamide acetyltransferase [Bifidobacterium anseris]|uniref:Dihydrolipoamide acetyltransferase n=2 Tax=Bifidobacterium TaxID=1678 RepID=A0A2N5IYH8_9BIFI|nr:hypothetical protein [Bifidobacterium anseris]PLS27015.1 dihydrolipoamide acetyltransferase [Bifidobacterium anseris]
MSFNEQPQVPPMPSAPQPAPDMQRTLRELSDPKVKVGNLGVSVAAVTTVVAAVLAIIAMFLPCVTVSVGGLFSQTVSLIQGDGWIVLILAIAVAVLAVIRQALAAFVVAVLNFLLWLFETVNTGHVAGEASSYSDLVQVKVSYGAGYWLWAVTVFVILIATGIEFYNMMQLKKTQAASTPGAAPAAPVAPYPMGTPPAPAAPQAPVAPAAPAPSYAAPAAAASTVPTPAASAADASLPPYAAPVPPAASVTEVSQTDVYQVPDPSSPTGADDVVVEQQTAYGDVPNPQAPTSQSPQQQ